MLEEKKNVPGKLRLTYAGLSVGAARVTPGRVQLRFFSDSTSCRFPSHANSCNASKLVISLTKLSTW